MPDVTGLGARARRWLLKLEGERPTARSEAFAGTGLEALAATEHLAGARAVVSAALRGRLELADASPGGLGAALGLALGGERVALFTTGAELAREGALLASAVARRAPLVVHVVAPEPAIAAVVEAGAAVWTPRTVAEAADLAIAVRRFAERALATVVLALDGPALATALSDAELLDSDALSRLLGAAGDTVHLESAIERVLFGVHRRRVPRWLDAEAAARLGAAASAESAALAYAGSEVFFAAGREAAIDEATGAVARTTGRALPVVAGTRLGRSDLGILAAGPAAETAGAVAGRLRAKGVAVRVLAVQRLAPLPATELVDAIGPCRRLAVLERIAAPGGRGALHAAVDAALGATGVPAALASLVVPGSAPLTAADLDAACRALAARFRPRLVVGAGAARDDGDPKRRAFREALAHDYPEADALQGHGTEPLALRPVKGVTITVVGGSRAESLAGEAGRLLVALAGGRLRSRLGGEAAQAGEPVREWLCWAGEALPDPGDAPPADVVLLLEAPRATPLALAPGATLLAVAPAPALPRALHERVVRGEAELLEIEEDGDPATTRERRLGALAGVLVRRGVISATESRLRSRREAALADLSDAERAALLDAFAAGVTAPRAAAPRLADAVSETPPLAMRLAGSAVPELGAAATAPFWDRVGRPLAEGSGGGLGVDPVVAAGVEPPCSAPLAQSPARLPVLEAPRCVACGDCWSACPHDAILARVMTPAALLEHGLVIAARGAGGAEPFRRFAARTAARWARSLVTIAGPPVATRLAAAAEDVLAEAKLDGERAAAATAAAAAVRERLAPLPLVACETLFAERETAEKGSGELLALAVDPERCTACGLCVAVCAPSALVEVTAERELVETARAGAAATAELPPPSPASVERARRDPRIGPLAGALLAPESARPLAGADAAPAGSPERAAVRQALGLFAHHLAPRRRAIVAEAEEIGARLAAAIHERLASALPDGDLAALARGLDGLDGAASELAAVVDRLSGAMETVTIDVAGLRRLVDAARSLGALSTPRAPFTLVVGDGEALAWARRFPDNPFGVPALVAAEAPLATARGLASAAVERALAEARAMRGARLALERPGEALTAAARLADLGWSDLDPRERALATPVVALLDDAAPSGELELALDLLSSDLPIAWITVAGGAGISQWSALAWSATSGVVAHATIAAPEPIDAAAEAFAAGAGVAFARVLAPARAATEPVLASLDRARGAVEAREFPLGCRVATADPAIAAPRVDPLADADERERRHATELAALAARHAEELARLESELRGRLAEQARRRLAELAARRRREREEGREAS